MGIYSFSNAKIDGSFNGKAKVSSPGVLVFLYANDLNQQLESVTKAGGGISKPVFEFPRGEDSIFVTKTGMNLQYGQSKFSRR